MNNFIKLSEVKENKLMQEEMRRVNGGELTQGSNPPPPPPDDGEDTGVPPKPGEAITQDYG